MTNLRVLSRSLGSQRGRLGVERLAEVGRENPYVLEPLGRDFQRRDMRLERRNYLRGKSSIDGNLHAILNGVDVLHARWKVPARVLGRIPYVVEVIIEA